MDREYRGERKGYKYAYTGQQRNKGPKKEFRFTARVWKDEKTVHEHESAPTFTSVGAAVQAGEKHTLAWIDAN